MIKEIPSFPGYFIDDNANVYSNKVGFMLKMTQFDTGGGTKYKTVIISKGGKGYLRMVHNLVLEAFVGIRPDGMLGLHKEPNTNNNSLQNLYWGTPKQNALDRIKDLHSPKGMKAHTSKLTDEMVLDIRKRYGRNGVGGLSTVALSKEYGVMPSTINCIVNKRTWTHI